MIVITHRPPYSWHESPFLGHCEELSNLRKSNISMKVSEYYNFFFQNLNWTNKSSRLTELYCPELMQNLDSYNRRICSSGGVSGRDPVWSRIQSSDGPYTCCGWMISRPLDTRGVVPFVPAPSLWAAHKDTDHLPNFHTEKGNNVIFVGDQCREPILKASI